ncbi:hypothetical protein PIIN_11496 [Serendipita indica DSM 11827]|uniref:Uncharacterized protein n=1 Tax=Serendipita indica (strain DSM 11827) TaxID=1109443 RepID=G4U1S6_SERID|nr:hypothetical protein PIIN_11496 [Serendipita indica DSM 11827]
MASEKPLINEMTFP